MMCQDEPNKFPWQWATDRIARIHCKFLAVSITGPWCAEAGKDAVGSGVPAKIWLKWVLNLKSMYPMVLINQ